MEGNKTKKNVILGLVVLCSVMLLGTGYAIASLLVERMITGSVTIASQPDLYILDGAGASISTLSFGQLNNGAHLTKVIQVFNAGNAPLKIAVTRTDSVTQISSVFKKGDGSAYDNAVPTTLNMGESLNLTVEIFNSVSVSAGSYQLGFKFSGSS